jgi:hypothetical protein
MKPMSILVMALTMTLTGLVLFVFCRAPVKRKKPPETTPQEIVVDEEPSHRVAIAPPALPIAHHELKAAVAGVELRWAELNKQAIAALDAGIDAKAVELFEQCHVAVPTEPIFTANLAEALARLASSMFDGGGGEARKTALAHMTRASELAPERDDIRRRLEQMRQLAKSEEGMWTDESEHFQLSYDGSRNDLLWRNSELSMVLEGAYQQYGELFGFYPVENGRAKIRVILYRREGFHEATGIGHWAGGLYDGTVRVPVEDLGREKQTLTRVLRHELAHAFVHDLGGRTVPGWINEGLAQRLEGDSMAIAQSTLAEARKRIAGKPVIPLAELSGSLGDQKEAERISHAYAQSLAFVGWIERTYGERVPYEMVAGCKDGTGLAGAFEKRTGVKLDDAFSDFAQGL